MCVCVCVCELRQILIARENAVCPNTTALVSLIPRYNVSSAIKAKLVWSICNTPHPHPPPHPYLPHRCTVHLPIPLLVWIEAGSKLRSRRSLRAVLNAVEAVPESTLRSEPKLQLLLFYNSKMIQIEQNASLSALLRQKKETAPSAVPVSSRSVLRVSRRFGRGTRRVVCVGRGREVGCGGGSGRLSPVKLKIECRW